MPRLALCQGAIDWQRGFTSLGRVLPWRIHRLQSMPGSLRFVFAGSKREPAPEQVWSCWGHLCPSLGLQPFSASSGHCKAPGPQDANSTLGRATAGEVLPTTLHDFLGFLCFQTLVSTFDFAVSLSLSWGIQLCRNRYLRHPGLSFFPAYLSKSFQGLLV